MSNSRVNIFIDWLTRRNHISILELHGLCTMCPKFFTNNHLTSLCPTFHNKSQYTIARPPNSKTSEKLVSERLSLSNSTKPSVVAVLWKLEPFLYHLGRLSDPSSLLTENVLCLCGSDDDLGSHRRNPNLDAGVTVLSELTGQYLVQLGVENSFSYELSPFSKEEISNSKALVPCNPENSLVVVIHFVGEEEERGERWGVVYGSLFAVKAINIRMELADRAVGFLLSFISLSIFTYYTFWVIILPFVDSDHFIHEYFLPQEYAILVPVFAGVVLLCFLCVFIGFVMLKSKKKKA
ncbi:hypothetical protein CMV_027619 [Castanea mollissima]|uniref:Dolichol phosphate-mannose biosynthesis regulatory protein n=2 Tax=Fagaceae TaxID=3503 RepID=A0A8J4VEW6_9ROSI|nr:hypothetical protein CMV_027619 [Castanea mollissima]